MLYDKLLEKYKGIWTKIESLSNIKLNALTVYDEVCANFRGLSVPKDDMQFESFTVASVYSLLVCEKKFCLQWYKGNCTYKTVTAKKMKFFVKIFSVNVTISTVTRRFGHFYWKYPYWKTSFLVQCVNKQMAKMNDYLDKNKIL